MNSNPKVWNKRNPNVPKQAVYIGRPSKFGNPFSIGKDGDRTQVITKYRMWLNEQPELIAMAKQELKGKDLVCFCAPQPCHGDTLLAIANRSV
jgi:hypothetical protein